MDRPTAGHNVATTGVAELHSEPTALGINAAGWVALSMLVVIGIILWQRVPGAISRALDSRIATIRNRLSDAAELRKEAENLLANARARDEASAGDAEAIVRQAEAEARAVIAKAEADATTLIARRQAMAEDKISAAERSAVAEVRARAAAAAAAASRSVIAARHDASADRALIDQAISRLN